MAIYHFSQQAVSRSKGHSVVAGAAYRAGERLRDERAGETRDFTPKADNVVHSEIRTPDGAPDWTKDREQLWNAVEHNERRWNSQLAHEIRLALPHELNDAERVALTREFVDSQLTPAGMIADVAIHRAHRGGDQRNDHAHILVTTRAIGETGEFSKHKLPEMNNKAISHERLTERREAWANMQNRALELSIERQRLEAEQQLGGRQGEIAVDKPQRQEAVEKQTHKQTTIPTSKQQVRSVDASLKNTAQHPPKVSHRSLHEQRIDALLSGDEKRFQELDRPPQAHMGRNIVHPARKGQHWAEAIIERRYNDMEKQYQRERQDREEHYRELRDAALTGNALQQLVNGFGAQLAELVNRGLDWITDAISGAKDVKQRREREHKDAVRHHLHSQARPHERSAADNFQDQKARIDYADRMAERKFATEKSREQWRERAQMERDAMAGMRAMHDNRTMTPQEREQKVEVQMVSHRLARDPIYMPARGVVAHGEAAKQSLEQHRSTTREANKQTNEKQPVDPREWKERYEQAQQERRSNERQQKDRVQERRSEAARPREGEAPNRSIERWKEQYQRDKKEQRQERTRDDRSIEDR